MVFISFMLIHLATSLDFNLLWESIIIFLMKLNFVPRTLSIQGTVVLGRLHKLSNSVGDPNRKNTIQYRSTWRRYMFYVDYLLCKITEVVHLQLIFFVFLSRNSEVRSFLGNYDRSQPPPNGKQEPTI